MKKIVVMMGLLYATSSFLFVPAASAQKSASSPKTASALKKDAARDKNINAILLTDKAMAKLSMDSSAQIAFDRYTSTDATLFRPRAVRAANFRSAHPLPPDLLLTWQPTFGDVSRAGDLAFTTGPWASTTRTSQGDPHFGQYLSIWRKQNDGRWLMSINASPAGPAELKIPAFKAQPTAAPYVATGKPLNEKALLLEADNKFANGAKTLDYAALMKTVSTPDLRLVRGAYDPTIGIDSVVAQTSGARITMWFPVEAVVAASGDLGYTRGSYVITLPRGSHEQGDYVRVWRREKNGTWRVALDMLTGGR